MTMQHLPAEFALSTGNFAKKPESMRSGSPPTKPRFAAQSSHEMIGAWGIQTGSHHKSVARCITTRLNGRQWVPSRWKKSAASVSPWFELGAGGLFGNGRTNRLLLALF